MVGRKDRKEPTKFKHAAGRVQVSDRPKTIYIGKKDDDPKSYELHIFILILKAIGYQERALIRRMSSKNFH